VLKEEEHLLPKFNDGQHYGGVFFIPKGLDKTNVRIGVGLEKNFKTIGSANGDVTKTMRSYENVFLYPAVEADGITHVNADYRFPEGKREAWRLIAVDTAGKQHLMSRGSSSESKQSVHCQRFIDLPVKQIKAIHFQTQPLEYVTIKNVSLKPDFKTDMEVEVEQRDTKAVSLKVMPVHGGQIELVGVRRRLGDDLVWFTADGKATIDANDERLAGRSWTFDSGGDRDKQWCEFFVHADLPHGRDGMCVKQGWRFEPEQAIVGGYANTFAARQQYFGAHMGFAEQVSNVDVTVRFSNGPWKTVAVHDQKGNLDRHFVHRGVNQAITLGEPVEKEGSVHITVSHFVHEMATRIVAVYKGGRVRYPSDNQFRPGPHKVSTTCRFDGLLLGSIDHYEFQVQPIDIVTFRDIALKEGVHTTPTTEVKTISDSEPLETFATISGTGYAFNLAVVDADLASLNTLTAADLETLQDTHVSLKELNLPPDTPPDIAFSKAGKGDLYLLSLNELVTARGTKIAPLKLPDLAHKDWVTERLPKMSRREVLEQLTDHYKTTRPGGTEKIALEQGQVFQIVSPSGQWLMMFPKKVSGQSRFLSFLPIGRLNRNEMQALRDRLNQENKAIRIVSNPVKTGILPTKGKPPIEASGNKRPQVWSSEDAEIALDSAAQPVPTEGVDVTGRVVDEAGKPVAGAVVEARTSSMGRMLWWCFKPQTLTDSAGQFRLRLPFGDIWYWVTAKKSGYDDAPLRLIPNKGKSLQLTLKPKGAGKTFQGLLVDAAGQPVPETKVTLLGEYGQRATANTDAQGRFKLGPFHGFIGQAVPIARANGLVSRQQIVRGRDDNVRVVLDKPARLTGIVLDQDHGKPIAGAMVVVRPHFASGFRLQTVSGADGRFEVTGLPEGMYKATASSPTHFHRPPRGMAVDLPDIPLAPGQTDSITIEMRRVATVRGQVVSSSGQAVPGAVVCVRSTWEGDYRDQNRYVFADKQGRFTISTGHLGDVDEPPGLSACSSQHGLARVDLKGLASGEQQNVTLQLRGAVEIKGTVTDRVQLLHLGGDRRQRPVLPGSRGSAGQRSSFLSGGV
jgi:hypothetical protein